MSKSANYYLQSALNSVLGDAEEAKPSQQPVKSNDFIASSKFQGAKPGFYFAKGPNGLGCVL